MRRNDGCGDGGERIHIVATSFVERGWNAAEIKQEIAARYWHFAIPLDWDDSRLRQEIERCIVKVRPLETKPAAKADQISDGGLRSIDEAAPDDVAASDLRAVQRAIASGRWRENSQAKQWAGHALAAAMKLDVETHKAKIVALLKTWIGNGALVVVEGEDEQRKKRSFVEVGSVAE